MTATRPRTSSKTRSAVCTGGGRTCPIRTKALPYLRSCVLNACRSALRRKRPQIDALPAEKLPDRQREVLVLRFYLGLTEAQIAAQMGIGQSTARPSAHRAFATLGRMLKESS